MTNELKVIEETRPTTNSIEAEKAIAEVKGMLTIAMSCPRDELAAETRIINACGRAGLAMAAEYSFMRAGQEIVGPTIRLAEVLAQNWGNISWGIKEISRDAESSVYKSYAWDMQTNARNEEEFTVPHYRQSGKFRNKLTSDRDILEAGASVGKRKVRNCILAIIPPDVTEAAVAECRATLQETIQTDKESIKKAIKAFEDYDVSRAQIEQYLGRSIEGISARQMVGLKRIYAGLQDGLGTASDYFKAEERAEIKKPKEKKGTKALKEKLNQEPEQEADVTTESEEISDEELAEMKDRILTDNKEETK